MNRLLIATWLVLMSLVQPGVSAAAPVEQLASPNRVARCVENVGDGGFEDYPDNWQWTQESNQGHELIERDLARTGLYKADLGGTTGSVDTLSQIVNVPATAYTATLSFYELTDAPLVPDADTLTVSLYQPGSAGALLAQLFVVGNASGDTGWQVFEADVSEWRGRDVELRFRAVNTANYPTFFYVDDVSIQSCTRLSYLPLVLR